MYRTFKVILSVLVIVDKSLQASVPSDIFYNAGVVEFRPSSKLTNFERLQDNLDGYLQIIASEGAKSLDIIVFPECTLNSNIEPTFVPDPRKSITVPCDSSANEYHNFLIELSCAARNTSKYLVINLTEKESCSEQPLDKRPCASSGLNIFNTNVVFDRAGAVISRYRKVHLYGENTNTTLVPEFGWFDTDFGVRFGHFVCFDILFYSPAQELVDKFGIKDFIFPTMWFSQLPFLTAVQFHQAWSYGNDVNLLAAGASYPSIGSTGSGIYNGRNGMLVATMRQGMGERTLYTARVPKDKELMHIEPSSKYQTQGPPRLKGPSPSSPRRTKPNINLKTDHLQSYQSVLIDLRNRTSLSQELCFKNSTFCCHFDIQWLNVLEQHDSKHYQYRLGVFDGYRYEEGIDSNQLKNCAVFSCTGPDIMDCGSMFDIDTDVIFENITITASFPRTDTFLLMPSSLVVEDLMPVPVNDFEWSEFLEEHNFVRIRYSLNTNAWNLMAFSIYGNYFDSVFNEHPTSKDDGATSLVVSVVCLILVILIQFIA